MSKRSKSVIRSIKESSKKNCTRSTRLSNIDSYRNFTDLDNGASDKVRIFFFCRLDTRLFKKKKRFPRKRKTDIFFCFLKKIKIKYSNMRTSIENGGNVNIQ